MLFFLLLFVSLRSHANMATKTAWPCAFKGPRRHSQVDSGKVCKLEIAWRDEKHGGDDANGVCVQQANCLCDYPNDNLKLLFHSVVHGEPCFEATRRFMHPASFAGWFPVIQYQAHTVQHTHAEVGATSAF